MNLTVFNLVKLDNMTMKRCNLIYQKGQFFLPKSLMEFSACWGTHLWAPSICKMVPREWQPVTAALAHFWAFSSFYISFALFNYSFFTTLLSSLFGSMETRLAFFVLVSILLFSTFSTMSGEPVCRPIVYSRDQLLAISSAAVPLHERLMSLASWGRGEDAGAVPELFVIAGGHATDPPSCLSSWGM